MNQHVIKTIVKLNNYFAIFKRILETLSRYMRMPMQSTGNFNGGKNDNFQLKMFDVLLVFFAQNIDCGYTLELLQ